MDIIAIPAAFSFRQTTIKVVSNTKHGFICLNCNLFVMHVKSIVGNEATGKQSIDLENLRQLAPVKTIRIRELNF